jgi:cellulose synthase/poly-beta-1,6-N-acetylglucosamine synthase-like glycosyltransferase
MFVSVIIAFYKNIDALHLILKALDRQSENNFEVIIAEDDNDNDTLQFVDSIKTKFFYEITHLRQEADNGFRKNEMLNKSIRESKGDMIVFLDGDSIPHKHLIKEYVKNAKEGVALFGRRVMLSIELTQKLYMTKDLRYLTFLNIIRTKSKRIKYAIYLPFVKTYRDKGIWGCNWGIMKKHLMEVNGFDEDYIRAGVGEDVDIEWRLKLMNIKLLSIRYGAIVYHLHHDENYSVDDINYNLQLFEDKRKKSKYFCSNGLNAEKIDKL